MINFFKIIFFKKNSNLKKIRTFLILFPKKSKLKKNGKIENNPKF